jgi:quercetin dioxygenase-like cupin family protein
MEKRTQRPSQLRYETVMEGADMQANIYTLAAGQSVPWHFHSEITDCIFCLDGPMVVETRAPRVVHELRTGEHCTVSPKTAHRVYGKDQATCRYLIVQGVGVYDSIPVGSG